MKLFLHANLSRVDLSHYSNTTNDFMASIAQMSRSLVSLNLAMCHLVTVFDDLPGLVSLTSLDLGGCQFRDKSLLQLRPLGNLRVLRMGKTFVTTGALNVALRWFPLLSELDLFGLELRDGCVGALRTLTQLESLNLGFNNFEVLRLNPLKHLAALSLAECSGLTNESLYWLAGCKSLTHLDLTRTSRLTGKGLFQLRSLLNLESVALPPSSQLESEAFVFLRTLTRLRSLNLPRYPVSDLSFVTGMELLQVVNLASCPIVDLKPLRGKANLTTLNLQSCKGLCNESIESLQSLPYLASLNLAHCSVDDAACPALAQCCSLVELSLEGCDIGDLGLCHLATSLTRLHLIDLRGTRVTREELTMLQQLKLLSSIRLDPLIGGVGIAAAALDEGGGGGEEEENE